VRVLDLGRYQAGPRTALMLSRLGADVIKVEPPDGEESRGNGPNVRGQSAYWVQYNSGKRSLGLNLYSDQGRDIVKRLVKLSDILIQNFRPGTMDEMGLGYETLRGLNPRIVMVNISAYGQYGPYRDRVGFDMLGQAMSGLMMSTGYEGMPPVRLSFPLIDRITALHATIGALAALWESRLSGQGQCIDVCLADTGYTTQEIPISYFLGTGKVQPRTGNGSNFINTYPCTDGWAYLICIGPEMWRLVAKAIGHEEWLEDPRFATREKQSQIAGEIEAVLSDWFRGRTVQEAIALLTPQGIPVERVNTVAEAAADPHMKARNIMMEVPDPRAGSINVVGDIFHFSRGELNIGPAPLPGQHTEEVLTGLLGMSKEDLAQLRAEKVV
jgi:crotonobetainyl-CoA:carnitine CoA-transferase CaiB-like acyl-CoA transferase